MEEDKNYWDNWMRRRMSRRNMLQRAGLTGLVIAGGSSLWACGQPTTPKAAEPTAKAAEPAPTAAKPAATPTPAKARPKRGGALKVGVNKTEQPENLDTHVQFVTSNDVYLRCLFDWVVNHDDSLSYVPRRSLAEKWDIVDDVTIRFTLRKGVKFSDGTEFNSQVVKFNMDRIANPETKSPRAYVVDAIKSIDYPDSNTVKVVLKEPMASFLGELSHPGLGILSPAAVAKWDPKELARNPVGTGPYIMTEFVRDDHYLMIRNKDYWEKDENGDQIPYVDSIRFNVIPDDTVRLANLRTGVIDVDKMTNLKDVAKSKEDPNLKVLLQQGVLARGTFWNMSRPPVSNLNFRKACQAAINREAMVKVVTFGLSIAYNGIIQPSHAWAYDPKRPVIAYDPVKAKQYLDRAIAEGVKPEFTTHAATGLWMQVAEMMQADLAKVGIKMNIVAEENVTSNYRFWTSFEIDAVSVGYSAAADPFTKIFVAHHSKGAYVPEKRDKGATWDTPEGYFAKVDPLIEAANRTYDPKKRAELFYKASDVVDEQVGFLGVHYATNAITMHKKVEGVYGGGDGKGRFERVWINA